MLKSCLLSIFEKCKSTVNTWKHFGTLLADYSKTFDCNSHKLLLAKLHVYSFGLPTLILVHGYRTNRKQGIKTLVIAHERKSCLDLNVSLWVTQFMRISINDFFKWQFIYCLLVSMIRSHTINYKISQLKVRCLQVIYNDKASSFKELNEKDGSVRIHNRNIVILVTEIIKVYDNIVPLIFREVLINEI